MRLVLSIVMALMFTSVIGAACLLVWGYNQYQLPGPTTEAMLFRVEKGDHLGEIAGNLFKADALTNPKIFEIAGRLQEVHTQIKAGEYEIPPASSPKMIMDLIVSGHTYKRQITIPEGLTSAQITDLINNAPALDGVLSPDMLPEGSILAETYSYEYGDTRQQVLSRMKSALVKLMDELWPKRAEGLPYETRAEALVLASIVEKETGLARERGKVAGVFVNRMRKNMKLQSDPTVIYAMTNGNIQDDGQGPLGRRLLRKDLSYDSPYNTYMYAGLPPAPIAHVGKDSIVAVLHPVGHDYLYFVADGTGGHVFARNLDAHNKNVAKWRRVRKEMERTAP